ncbi:MAG: chemotaxis protein CheW [Methanospirillum sp.]|uniref:chemotaxis protein CheW n=1 Tax=Methanospirillum sp. TaxID=45200 RepID=UPI00236DF957|nr:chemotaxis protein CheW [Methanospirillum sp.]MDD1729556.1 chemotaxis protein CheW [Methanospirillum sp.]
MKSEGLDEKQVQVVEFSLGDELYAIDLFEVKEVVDYTSITPLPHAPDYVKGIINLRGEITSIIDLQHCLHGSEHEFKSTDTSRIIVLDEAVLSKKIGILVDDVRSVATLESNQIDYTSASQIGDGSLIIGIIKRNTTLNEKELNELIIWIDIKQLLHGID